MKKTLALLLSLILILCAAGALAADEQVTIRYSWWGSDTRHQATLAALDLYMERHPNVTIEAEYGAYSSYYQQVVTQFAGKQAADIISVDYKWVSDWVNQGEPFVNMSTLTDIIDMSGFDMDFVGIYGQVGDTLAGLPCGVNAYGYLYNVSFFEKYGITAANDWTWDTVIEYGEKVQSIDSADHLLYLVSDHWGNLFKAMLKQTAGVNLADADYAVAFTAEDALPIFQYVRRLVDTGTVPTFEEAVPYENVYADQNPEWLAGKIGVFATSSSLVPGIASASEFPVEALRYPVMENPVDPGILVVPSMFVTVYKESAHPDVAADIINFLLNDPDAIRLQSDVRGIPASKPAMDQLVAENLLSKQVSDMVEQGLTGAAMAENEPSLNPEVIALMKLYIQRVGYNELTPEAASEQFVAELADLLGTLKP